MLDYFAVTGVKFGSRNVLADPAIREAIKEYSNWPTIPQVPPSHITHLPYMQQLQHVLTKHLSLTKFSAQDDTAKFAIIVLSMHCLYTASQLLITSWCSHCLVCLAFYLGLIVTMLFFKG